MIEFFIFIFGATVGSFLNVLILRLPKGEDVVKERSHCQYCQKKLAWYELIPVLSFIIQKGKCRACGKKISYQYIIVELLTGFLFLLTYLYLNFNNHNIMSNQILNFDVLNSLYLILYTLYFFYIICTFIAISFIDYKTFYIPDILVFPAIIVSLIFNIVFNASNFSDVLNNILSAFAIFLFFFAFYFFSKGRAMGFGDAKLGFLIGLFLPLPFNIFAIMVSFILGGIFGIILLAFKKADRKTLIPFGPFMVIGDLIVFFFPEFFKNIFWL